MRRHVFLALGLTLVAALAGSSAAVAGSKDYFLDWQVSQLYLKSEPPVEEGKYITFHCHWTAVVSESGDFASAITWTGYWYVDDVMVKPFDVSYSPNLLHYIKPGTTNPNPLPLPTDNPNVYGTATNEFDGDSEFGWIPQGVGKHVVRCSVAEVSSGGYMAEKMVDRNNNAKNLTVSVAPSTTINVPTTAWPDAPVIVTPTQNMTVGTPATIVVKPYDPSVECTNNGKIFVQVTNYVGKLPYLHCSAQGVTFTFTLTPGTHQVRAQQVNTAHNYASHWSDWRTFTVVAKTSVSAWKSAPKAALPKPVVSPPMLTLSVLSASIDPDCKDSGKLATVTVSVHNSGFPLAASEGWLVLKDASGQLTSTLVTLPAIAANGTASIIVTLGASVPPPSLIGTHSLSLALTPKAKAGQRAFNAPAGSTPYQLAFPSGYCPTARMIHPPLPRAQRR